MQSKIKKRGQVSVFVITALVIVVLFIAFFLIRGITSPNSDIKPAPEAVSQYLAECISSHILEASKLLIEGSGYMDEPALVMDYNEEKIPYLCYTPDYYSRCINKEPVIMDHLTEEIYVYLNTKVEQCLKELVEDLEDDGYFVSEKSEGTFEVEIMPKKIEVVINKKIEIEKAGEIKEFEKFVTSAPSKLYDFTRIVQRITEEEAKYVNSEYLNIMASNPWIDINKFVTGDHNKIYTLTEVKTGVSWKFAVRGGILSTPS